jgi:curved DNA-binding protein CbpA
LQEGIELHWPPERVFGGLEAKLMQYATSNNQFKELQQQLPSDDAVLEFQGGLDGSQTLWKLLQQAKTPRALATTWVIDAAGGIDYRDEAAEEEQEAPLEVEVVFQDTPSDRSDPKAAGAAVAARRAPAPRGVATDLATQISRRFEQMDDLNYYECFDLAPDVPMIDIKKAYLLAAKRYHPDALARAGLGDELRRQANKIFSKISKAYATLSNPRKRGEYDSALGSDSSPIDAEHLANAETLYRKGEVLLGLGNFKGAVEFLAPAVDLWPDEADYQSALGWALFKKMPSEPEPSREHLEKAVTMAPEDATASFRLSFVLRALGQSADADAWLRRSRQLDPNIA